jgi:hypothetical protein
MANLTSGAIFKNYVTVMNDYLTHFTASDKFKKTDKDGIFLLIHGLNTLTHIFKITLNQNLEKALENTEHSIYYYTQFIEQMEENLMYDLNVSSNTAALFVYKKTISQVLPEIAPSDMLKNVADLLLIYRTIVDVLLQDAEGYDSLIPSKLSSIAHDLCAHDLCAHDLCAHDLCAHDLCADEVIFRQELVNVKLFIDHMAQDHKGREIYISLYIKKYKHRKLTLEGLCHKKADPNYTNKRRHDTVDNYIKWLLKPK